jgi:uncharacterized membrane protein YvlD (DUF360 family)
MQAPSLVLETLPAFSSISLTDIGPLQVGSARLTCNGSGVMRATNSLPRHRERALPSHVAILFASGLVILIVGSMTRSLEVKDFGSAFSVALVMTIAGWVLSTALAMAQTALMASIPGAGFPSGPDGPGAHAIYVGAAFAFVVNVILFLVIASLMSGVTIRGFLGPLLAVVLITAVELAVPRALFEAGLGF